MKVRRQKPTIHEWFIDHDWFGEDAPYLVIPRSALQTMPPAWRSRFIGCMNALDRAIDWYPVDAEYTVNMRGRNGRFMSSRFDPLMDFDGGERRLPFATEPDEPFPYTLAAIIAGILALAVGTCRYWLPYVTG